MPVLKFQESPITGSKNPNWNQRDLKSAQADCSSSFAKLKP